MEEDVVDGLERLANSSCQNWCGEGLESLASSSCQNWWEGCAGRQWPKSSDCASVQRGGSLRERAARSFMMAVPGDSHIDRSGDGAKALPPALMGLKPVVDMVSGPSHGVSPSSGRVLNRSDRWSMSRSNVSKLAGEHLLEPPREPCSYPCSPLSRQLSPDTNGVLFLTTSCSAQASPSISSRRDGICDLAASKAPASWPAINPQSTSGQKMTQGLPTCASHDPVSPLVWALDALDVVFDITSTPVQCTSSQPCSSNCDTSIATLDAQIRPWRAMHASHADHNSSSRGFSCRHASRHVFFATCHQTVSVSE